MSADPRLSVAICTRNRAGYLQGTLDSLTDCELHRDSGIEIIVVDNNSTDETAEVARARCVGAGNVLRYSVEKRPGLSYARNKAFALSRAPALAFVDDDVYFSGRWLRVVMGALATEEAFACFGGRTEPLFEGGEPEWLVPEFHTFFGSSLMGDVAEEMQPPKIPFGVNMIVRREVWEKIGGFREDLGRRGQGLMSGEEDEFFRRAYAAGFRIKYVPEALLYHRIPQERVSKRWLLSRSYWAGRSNAAVEQYFGEHGVISSLRAAYGEWRELKAIYLNRRWYHPKRQYWHAQAVQFPEHARAVSCLGAMRTWTAGALRCGFRGRSGRGA